MWHTPEVLTKIHDWTLCWNMTFVPKVMRMILKKFIEHTCNYSLSPSK
jgi:hypothetical protein